MLFKTLFLLKTNNKQTKQWKTQGFLGLYSDFTHSYTTTFTLVEFLWNYSNVSEIIVRPYDISSYKSLLCGYLNCRQLMYVLFFPVVDS